MDAGKVTTTDRTVDYIVGEGGVDNPVFTPDKDEVVEVEAAVKAVSINLARQNGATTAEEIHQKLHGRKVFLSYSPFGHCYASFQDKTNNQ